jgi:hypothetical protein
VRVVLSYLRAFCVDTHPVHYMRFVFAFFMFTPELRMFLEMLAVLKL